MIARILAKKNISRLSSKQEGFTLVETIIYLFIMSMLVLLISSLVMTIFNARRQLKASHIVHHNARFIVNYLTNKIHNVDLIDDVSPAPEQLHFYQLPDTRFSIAIESDDLIYRQTEDGGSGFPDQSTADPVSLNSNEVIVNNLTMSLISDGQGNTNRGVRLIFTLQTGTAGDSHGYVNKVFTTFISLR